MGKVVQFPWLDLCKSDSGKIVCNVASALIALRFDDGLRDALGFDEMLVLPVLRHEVGQQGNVFPQPIPLRDDHEIAIAEYLQNQGLNVSVKAVHDAVLKRTRECAFNPLQLYLRNLVWDQQPRVNVWLTTRLGVVPSPYSEAIGRMFLIAMVARAMAPGCKADHMLILEGPQGTEKSTACAVLGGAYFSDHLPDLRNGKDTQQHLRGKWLIEVPELHAFSKAETAHLKAFISRDTERYRPSYGRHEVVEPRSCMFVGTTNKENYLRDETGGRRFWGAKIGAIDIDGLIEDRDQLFAEARSLYEDGAQWWADGSFERQVIAPAQEDRYEPDVWEEIVGRYLRAARLERVLVSDIARDALGFDASRIGTADQRRITAVLERLGWQRGRRTGADGSRWWVPSDALPDAL
jgi:predicted P-loop ATPase